jgi:undecaprenyl-diphosphatase
MVSIVILLHIIVLAVVQGITEFLPISSSAHLILVPIVFQWPDQGLLMDVAVHVGTLAAVMLYFWRDVLSMARGGFNLLTGRRDDNTRLVILLVVATIPVIIAGLLLKGHMDGMRDIRLIGWTTLVFGFLLYFADRFGGTARGSGQIGMRDAVMIGLAQAVALVPGTSRSGVTMTVARALGIARPDAARFALLMSIPTLIAAGSLEGYDLYKQSDPVLTEAAVFAVGLSFVTALVAIALLMAWLRRATFTPFVVYRVILGVILLAFGYGLV